MGRHYVVLLLVVAGCSPERVTECPPAGSKQLMRCAERHQGSETSMLLACLPFSKSERIRGQWFFDLEYSGFIEKPGQEPDETWLYIHPDLRRKVEWDTPPGNPVTIEFIGRRSMCDGAGYGHFGMTKRAIVVDRVLKMRR